MIVNRSEQHRACIKVAEWLTIVNPMGYARDMTEAMYIRFGALPESGRSWNDELQADEAGVSCYQAEWQSTDRDIISVSVPSDACIFTISQIEDRPVYVLTGDLLDERGGDGEPLLANARVIEVVEPVDVVNFCIEGDQ